MAKRRKLSDLVKEETQRPDTEVTESQSSEVTEVQSPEVTDLQTTEPPKYLTLIRKETRLREEQIDQLTAIARKLNRQKRGGERITENTLIRVAVDLLLARAESLSGDSEAALLDSLSLDATD